MFAAIILVLLFIRSLSATIDKVNSNPNKSTSSEKDRAVHEDDDASFDDAEALTSCEGAGGLCHPCPQYPGHIHHTCRAHTFHSQAQHAYHVKNRSTDTEAYAGHKNPVKSSHESPSPLSHDSVGQDSTRTRTTAPELGSSVGKSSPPDTSAAYSIDTATNESTNSTPPSTPSRRQPSIFGTSKLPAAMYPPARSATSSSSNSLRAGNGLNKSRNHHRCRIEKTRNTCNRKGYREHIDVTKSPVKASIIELVDMERGASEQQAMDQDEELQDILDRFSKITISAHVLYSPTPAASGPLPPPADVAPSSSPSPVLIPAPEPVEQVDVASKSSPAPVLIQTPEPVELADLAAESYPSSVLSTVPETIEQADFARDSSPSPVLIPVLEAVEHAEAVLELSESPAIISAPQTLEQAGILKQRDDVIIEYALAPPSELAVVPETREETQPTEDVVFKNAQASSAPVDEYDPNRPQIDLLQNRSTRRSAPSQSTYACELFAAAFAAGYENIPTSHVDELCGLNAIIRSIEANFPLIPLPTLEVLLEVFYSTEFTQRQQAGFLLDNSGNLHVDQVGALLHFWAARHLDLNLQLGIKIEGKEPYLVLYGSDSQHDRRVVWIYNDNAEEEFREHTELAVLSHFSGMKPKAFPVDDTEMVRTEYKSMEDGQDTEAVPSLNNLSGIEPLGVPVEDTEMVSTEDNQHGEASMEDDQGTRASPVLNDFPGMTLPDIVFNDTETVTAVEVAQLEAFMADDQYTDIGAFLEQYTSTNSNGLPLGDAEMNSTEDRQQTEALMEDEQDRPEALERPDSLMDDNIHPQATFNSYQSQRPASSQPAAVSGQLRPTQTQSGSANVSDAVMDDGYCFEPCAGSYVPSEPLNPDLQAIYANLGWNVPGTATNDRPRVFTDDNNRHESAVESDTSLATIDPRLLTESANLSNTNSATPRADASQTSMLNGIVHAQEVVATDLQSVPQRLDPAAAADLVASLNSTRRPGERVIRQPRSVLSRGTARTPKSSPSIFPSNVAVTNPPPAVANGFVAGLQQQSNGFNFSSSAEAGRIRFGGSQPQPQNSMLTPPDSPDNRASRLPDHPSKPVTKGPKPTAKDRARAAGRAPQTLVTNDVPTFDAVSPATETAQPATAQTRAASTPSTDSQDMAVFEGSTGNDFHAATAIFVPSATTTNHIDCPTEEEIYNAIHPRMGRRQLDLTLVIFRDRVNVHNRRLFRQRVKKVSWYTPCEQDPNEIVLYRDLEWKQAQVSSPPQAVEAPPAQSAPQQQMIPGLSLLGGEEEVVGDIADDEILNEKLSEDEQLARLLASRMEKDPEAYEDSESEGSESDIIWENVNVYPDDGLEGQLARPEKRQGRGDDDGEESGGGGDGEMGGGRRKRGR